MQKSHPLPPTISVSGNWMSMAISVTNHLFIRQKAALFIGRIGISVSKTSVANGNSTGPMRSIRERNGRSPKVEIQTDYVVTGCKGNYPTVRSELMFLLYKNPDIPRWGNPELAPVGRFFLRIWKGLTNDNNR